MTIALSPLGLDMFVEHQAAPGCVNGSPQTRAERDSQLGQSAAQAAVPSGRDG
jgi:hypothetical protein